jgi:hypothetical protein
MAPVFKELTTAVRNWHVEIFAYFDQPITNAYTESVNRLAKDMNRMGRGYSFEVIRARMLYDAKARKDGAAVEAVLVDDDPSFVDSTYARGGMYAQKKKARQIVEYGPYIPTLCKLLEDGHFE